MSRDGCIETWPREYKTPQELDCDYASAIRGSFARFPYCVRTPPARVFREYYPEQILCLGESRIVLFMHSGVTVSSVDCSLEAIDVLESETTLLSLDAVLPFRRARSPVEQTRRVQHHVSLYAFLLGSLFPNHGSRQ